MIISVGVDAYGDDFHRGRTYYIELRFGPRCKGFRCNRTYSSRQKAYEAAKRKAKKNNWEVSKWIG